MYVVRSEHSSQQELLKDERLRNVFVVFGGLVAVIVISHILYATLLHVPDQNPPALIKNNSPGRCSVKCRNTIPQLRYSPALRIPSIRTVPHRSYHHRLVHERSPFWEERNLTPWSQNFCLPGVFHIMRPRHSRVPAEGAPLALLRLQKLFMSQQILAQEHRLR